jgi:hypothetical protein
MNEINLDNISFIDLDNDNITEKLYIETCNDFKNRMKKKNQELYDLKLLIIKIYGILITMEETEEYSMIQVILEQLKNCFSSYFSLEDPSL